MTLRARFGSSLIYYDEDTGDAITAYTYAPGGSVAMGAIGSDSTLSTQAVSAGLADMRRWLVLVRGSDRPVEVQPQPLVHRAEWRSGRLTLRYQAAGFGGGGGLAARLVWDPATGMLTSRARPAAVIGWSDLVGYYEAVAAFVARVEGKPSPP